MLADADARADETALAALSVLTMLEISEPIDEETAERTLDAAEAGRPLVGAGEAVAESPVEIGRGTMVKLESVDEATDAVPDENDVDTGRAVPVSVADGTSVAVADGTLVSVPVAIGTIALSVAD